MKKKLLKAALISSPIVSMVGSVPLVIIERIQTPKIFILWIALAFTVFVFWLINIFIILKVKNTNSFNRYFLSFVAVLIIQFGNISIAHYLGIKPVEVNGVIFPLVPAIGINSLILLISNSIILQFQKRSAELEIERLKVNNLEAQKLILLQQLQPHFLFNALSTLKSLIGENVRNAENYTVRLSDFLRYSLQAKNNEVVSLAEEMAFTQNYIELQKVRFGDSFSCKIDISNEYFPKKIPVYALQALVENAIKHNAFTDKKPLFINVSLEDNRLKVSNNLSPKVLQLASGTGLENLNQRYKLIANTEIEIIKTEKNYTVYLPLF
jgi:two-component system, LytTR family, sensor kinase